MNLRNGTQISTPNMLAGSTSVPLTRSGGIPAACTIRMTAARITGAATTNAMKMVRRDHSISPSERSNTRRDAPMKDIFRVIGCLRFLRLLRPSLLHQVLEDRLQVVVGRLHFVDRPGFAGRGEFGEARVEVVRTR